MKISIQKTASVTIDTSIERRRIDNAFTCKGDNVPRQKLHKLMDLIEAENWKGAHKELRSKWWRGYDDKAGCPRLEFVGLIEIHSPFFEHHITYDDLINSFVEHPANYKVIGKKS